MKRNVLLVMLLVLALGVLSGCNNATNVNPIENGTEVLGKVNGVEITREMLKDELKALEKTAVTNYIDKYLIDDFYKDIEISEQELTIQMEILKGQVGEGQWDSYLNYMGYTDEKEFEKVVELDMKRTKMKTELSANVTITEEEIVKAFETYPDNYKYLAGDMLFFDTDEEYNSAKNMLNQDDMTLQAIADSLNKEIYPNENVTFGFAGFTKPMDEMEVGELVATTPESNTYAVISVKKVGKELEELKDSIRTSLVDEKANDLVENKLTQYYNEVDVEILGESLQ